MNREGHLYTSGDRQREDIRRLLEALKFEVGDCPNCRGQRCMACVVREAHDICADDCPNCAGHAEELLAEMEERYA